MIIAIKTLLTMFGIFGLLMAMNEAANIFNFVGLGIFLSAAFFGPKLMRIIENG